MNLRHSQSNFQSSMELGAVTEGVKNKPANVWTIMIPWLIGAVMFGGACYSGSGILLHSLVSVGKFNRALKSRVKNEKDSLKKRTK